MKKTTTSILCLCAVWVLNAQSQYILSPIELNGQPLSLTGEAVSENQTFVAGVDMWNSNPAIWNTVTGDVYLLEDFEMLYDEESMTPYLESYNGAFHSVNNLGLAVGEFGAPSDRSHAILFDINNPEEYEMLYEEEGEAGNSAYAISEDGSTIVGYHFDADWLTHACIWTNGGQTRTDLPWPTAEQCGFEIDYASARDISADGSIILGYVQDNNYGSWVFVYWERQADGSYVVNTDACQKYFEYDYQLGKPYMDFEPHNISANGEWVSLEVEAEFDPWDWDYTPEPRAARLNLKTNELEVLPVSGEIFGIANNGTAVGRFTSEDSWIYTACVWPANKSNFYTIEFFIEDDFRDLLYDTYESSLSDITSDASAATGIFVEVFDKDPYFAEYAFVAQLNYDEVYGDTDAIEQVNAPVHQGVAYDLQGRRTLNTNGHLIIIDGHKVLK